MDDVECPRGKEMKEVETMCFGSEELHLLAVETYPARQHKAAAEGGDEDAPAVGVDG